MTLRVSEEAGNDLGEARDWYDLQERGIGDKFLLAFDVQCSAILNAPETFRKLHGLYRATLIHHFPYRIIYRIEGLEVVIVAVIHTSRHDRVWKQRLR